MCRLRRFAIMTAIVAKDGVLFRGQRYRSLSAVARTITAGRGRSFSI
jgi:hypothetical protein